MTSKQTEAMKLALIDEATIQMADHPSKDARFFAKSVYEYLMAEPEQPTQRTYPQAERVAWVGLTDEQIGSLYRAGWANNRDFARAIEAKLKEKNT